MTYEEMREFEKCKEEKFFTDLKDCVFIDYIESKCQTSFDFIANKKILFELTSYILVSQLK